MKQCYLPKKIQEKRCSYCMGLEQEAQYSRDKIQTIEKFLTHTKQPLTIVDRQNLKNEEISTAMSLYGVKKKLSDCKFPYCDGKCGERESK